MVLKYWTLVTFALLVERQLHKARRNLEKTRPVKQSFSSFENIFYNPCRNSLVKTFFFQNYSEIQNKIINIVGRKKNETIKNAYKI